MLAQYLYICIYIHLLKLHRLERRIICFIHSIVSLFFLSVVLNSAVFCCYLLVHGVCIHLATYCTVFELFVKAYCANAHECVNIHNFVDRREEFTKIFFEKRLYPSMSNP